jgi:hypothetical protein
MRPGVWREVAPLFVVMVRPCIGTYISYDALAAM